MTAMEPVSFRLSMNFSSSPIGRAQKSMMFMPPTVTARLMSDKRLPRHLGQGRSDMHSSSSLRMASDCVSVSLRETLLTTPSNGRSMVPRPLARS